MPRAVALPLRQIDVDKFHRWNLPCCCCFSFCCCCSVECRTHCWIPYKCFTYCEITIAKIWQTVARVAQEIERISLNIYFLDLFCKCLLAPRAFAVCKRVWAWHTYAIYLSIAVGTLQDLTICQGSGKLTCGWPRCCSSIFSLSLLHSLFSLLLNRLLELALTIAAEDYRKSIIRRTLHGNKMAKRFCIVLLIFLCFAWNLANAIKIHQRASNLMCILFNRHIIQLDYVYCIIS